MLESPNLRNDGDRQKIADMLNACLVDLLALQAFSKLAHWNVRGPTFGPLHALFDELHDSIYGYADRVAERAAMLGALAVGTPTQVSEATSLEEYPVDTTDGLQHVRALVDRLKACLLTLSEQRDASDEMGAIDTFQLLTDVVMGLEQYGWKLVAHLQ